MRKTMVIPTYWARNSNEEWQEGDGVFDHPTPLDKEGTLKRTLESMKILSERDFKLVILVCPTTDSIEDEVMEKVKRIVKEANVSIETYIFGPQELRDSLEILKGAGVYEKADALLDLKHYAPVRNACLFVATILASEAVILIDDDEVFEIPDFVPRSVEFLGKRVYGDMVYGVAGYYLNKNNKYYDDVKDQAWMTYWDRFGCKARGFDKIIGTEPRLKRTTFVFGGAMIMHKEMFHTVPFDPKVTRGEDIDYLINSKMYGFSFFLDNTLSIKHLPEPKTHPRWKSLREDIIRFVYERAKLTSQYETGNMVMVTAKELEPYPGEFLGEDLDAKIYRSNVMSATDYLAQGDADGALESLENIHLGKKLAQPDFNPFDEYRKAQKDWVEVVSAIKDNRYELRKLMEANNMTQSSIVRNKEHVRAVSLEDVASEAAKHEIFSVFTTEEMMKVAKIAKILTYYENEHVFSAGDLNDSISYILKGKVSLSIPGEEIGIAILGKGSLIGESCMVHKTFRTNCTAREFTEFLVVPLDKLNELEKEDSAFAAKFMKMIVAQMSKKISDSNNRIREIMNVSQGNIDEVTY